MLMLYVGGDALQCFLLLMMRISWDTRDAAKPAAQLQAHDREILAVAFTPNVDFPHLILTGSADKVCFELALIISLSLNYAIDHPITRQA